MIAIPCIGSDVWSEMLDHQKRTVVNNPIITYCMIFSPWFNIHAQVYNKPMLLHSEIINAKICKFILSDIVYQHKFDLIKKT